MSFIAECGHDHEGHIVPVNLPDDVFQRNWSGFVLIGQCEIIGRAWQIPVPSMRRGQIDRVAELMDEISWKFTEAGGCRSTYEPSRLLSGGISCLNIWYLSHAEVGTVFSFFLIPGLPGRWRIIPFDIDFGTWWAGLGFDQHDNLHHHALTLALIACFSGIDMAEAWICMKAKEKEEES